MVALLCSYEYECSMSVDMSIVVDVGIFNVADVAFP